MDLEMTGDAALVTASSSGLGRASAAALARAGCDVAICGRDPDRLAAAEEALDTEGPGDVLGIQADLTDPHDVSDLVEATTGTFGGLDQLVTSAGGVPPGGFTDQDDRDWYGAYDTLVMSVVWTLREALPALADGGGSVVAITSTTVREVSDDLILSNAVRRGVIGLVKSTAREFAPDVRVNAVMPSAFETDRMTELIEAGVDRGDFPDYEAGYEAWADDLPVGRLGDPRELGDVVAFLSSPRASFVTGTAVPIDGGRLRS